VGEDAVVFDSVVKTYGAVQALRGATFRVPKGAIASLVGPNGAGKTTTLRICAGLLRRDYGVVRVFGADPWEDPEEVRTRIGYLPESPSLPKVSVETLLIHAAMVKGVDDPVREAMRVTRLAGLQGILGRKAAKLSAGWRQRLALAISLIGEPELLIMDEPAANLDPSNRMRLYDLIRSLCNDLGVSALISTHILTEAQQYSNYMIVISEGMIVAEGYTNELSKRVSSLVKARFRGRSEASVREAARDVLSMGGVRGVSVEGQYLVVTVEPDAYDEVKKALLSAGLKLVEEGAADLTDIYRKVVKEG